MGFDLEEAVSRFFDFRRVTEFLYIARAHTSGSPMIFKHLAEHLYYLLFVLKISINAVVVNSYINFSGIIVESGGEGRKKEKM